MICWPGTHRFEPVGTLSNEKETLVVERCKDCDKFREKVVSGVVTLSCVENRRDVI